jgi:hypothetical protein
MKPRDFLNFFNTKTGKLVLFVIVFGGVLMLFSAIRDKNHEGEIRTEPLAPVRTNDKPQTVQTVERPMEVFRPPAPKPEPPPQPKTNVQAKIAIETPKTPSTPAPLPPSVPPISLFADATAGVLEPKTPGTHYAPYGRLIPCQTAITVDSASIQTPIVGLITEDIYHAGRLVIPAGTEVHGTAQTDRHRERIASGNSWTLVWQTGEELKLKGVALDREFSGDQEGWGITDGSAGLRGRLLKTDDLTEIKLFAATLLSGAAKAMTEKETTILGSIDSRSLNNAPLKGAEDVLKIYSQRILEAIQRDGFYVRVASGKQFYLYVVQTIDRSEAVIGGTAKPFTEGSVTAGSPEPLPPAALPVATPSVSSLNLNPGSQP